MFIARYDPPKRFQKFSKGFENFNLFLDQFINRGGNAFKSDFTPSVNTREGENAYYIEVELPGVKIEDINVDVKGNVLTFFTAICR